MVDVIPEPHPDQVVLPRDQKMPLGRAQRSNCVEGRAAKKFTSVRRMTADFALPDPRHAYSVTEPRWLVTVAPRE